MPTSTGEELRLFFEMYCDWFRSFWTLRLLVKGLNISRSGYSISCNAGYQSFQSSPKTCTATAEARICIDGFTNLGSQSSFSFPSPPISNYLLCNLQIVIESIFINEFPDCCFNKFKICKSSVGLKGRPAAFPPSEPCFSRIVGFFRKFNKYTRLAPSSQPEKS